MYQDEQPSDQQQADSETLLNKEDSKQPIQGPHPESQECDNALSLNDSVVNLSLVGGAGVWLERGYGDTAGYGYATLRKLHLGYVINPPSPKRANKIILPRQTIPSFPTISFPSLLHHIPYTLIPHRPLSLTYVIHNN